MRLRKTLDLEKFFASVRECRGEVWFISDEDDRLNLKSSLCCFVFTVACLDGRLNLPGKIHCEDAEDQMRLAAFCEEG